MGSEAGDGSLVNPGLKTIIGGLVMEKDTICGGTGVPNCTLRIRTQAVVSFTQAQVFEFAEPRDTIR